MHSMPLGRSADSLSRKGVTGINTASKGFLGTLLLPRHTRKQSRKIKAENDKGWLVASHSGEKILMSGTKALECGGELRPRFGLVPLAGPHLGIVQRKLIVGRGSLVAIPESLVNLYGLLHGFDDSPLATRIQSEGLHDYRRCCPTKKSLAASHAQDEKSSRKFGGYHIPCHCIGISISQPFVCPLQVICRLLQAYLCVRCD
mmetsp:Transcript_17907/g.39732  ORF Transcript_17907/g.39732 Transcript_17907/m.39732 type:complete len:202 (+) Transcript_17907:325-930(+)